jgi:hypothetical protein
MFYFTLHYDGYLLDLGIQVWFLRMFGETATLSTFYNNGRYCLISKIDSDGPVYDRMKRPTPSLRIADNIFWLFGGALGAIM